MKKTILTGMVLSSLIAASSFANKEMKNPMTKEKRQKMAVAHEEMATCLRSDKLLKECREEMQKSCREIMGKDACMMHGEK